jgi:hypothetical protein
MDNDLKRPRFYASDLALVAQVAWALGAITGIAVFSIFA